MARLFQDTLADSMRRSNIVIGLDVPHNLPPHLIRPAKKNRSAPTPEESVYEFFTEIISATIDVAAGCKINWTFLAKYDNAVRLLKELIGFIQEQSYLVPVILDLKAGEVGHTSQVIAQTAFEEYAADAITVNPYFGEETLRMAAAYAGHGTVAIIEPTPAG